jgi:putative DNA primase/helicase
VSDPPITPIDERLRAIGREIEQIAGNGRDLDRVAISPRAVTVLELLSLKIAQREYLLEPILREKETAMIHAWRGVGKTYFALELSFAVASGGSFLNWSAPRPRRVLYVDGEMPARTMQERLASIVAASDRAEAFDPTNLRLVCADLQDAPLPNLSTLEGQQAFEPFVRDADLVVVDSISTLAQHGRENDAESWLPMQAWALDLRRRGKSVLLLHHAGKGGQQRGTSRKEDILDLVIGLRRPSDYQEREGARFEVRFEKARGLAGDAVAAFEAQLCIAHGQTEWTMRKLEDAQLSRAVALLNDGGNVRDLAQELGVSRATAYRLQKQARANGMIG